MSYTELEHGYQGIKNANRPIFYVGDISAQPTLVGPAVSSIYRSSKRSELSEGHVNEDGCMDSDILEGEGKQVLVGICAMARKSLSKPMKEILTRLEEFEYIKIVVLPEDVILMEPVENWPIVDCLISFHSKGFPLDKAIQYANLRNPFIINNLPMQYDIQDRRKVYSILDSEGIEIPRYAVLDRNSADPKSHELVESEDHVEVNGVTFNKPFVEKPVSAEDHNIYIYYPTSAGGGSQRLFRKIGSRSSVYSPESRVRKTGSYIYEDFMPTDGTDVKVYTVGPDYAHAEARKSPALDGKVERDSEGKEIRYPVILSNAEKLISRKVCLAFKQTVCGFDLLRANGKSFVCDVNGFSFVKNSNKYYDDCAKILGNMILRELAPTLHIPWSIPFQLDDPPIVPTTFGKMMELRCVVAVIRHGDRTPKQKMKVEVRHPKFFEIFAKYDGYKHGHVKLKRPKQLQEILDTARSLLNEIQHRAAGCEIEEKQGKLEQLKSVLEMYGHFSGINRKVQMKYQPRGRPRGSSSDDGNSNNRRGEPSLVLILKWGGELTPAGRIQAEELGRIFRCMYPGGQGRHLSGEYAGAQGLGLLRLHSTFRHDLKIYASDEGRVQMTAAAFAKGLLALEGELTPILVQMVKSANTNGLLDNDCDSSKYQNMAKTRLHELLQQDREFTREDREQINPGNALSINAAMEFVKNPVKCCQHVHALIQKLTEIVRIKKEEYKSKEASLYHGETWELMGRRWGKIEKDFCTKHKRFDISKIPDIYDCIKYDLQHNNHILQFEQAEELYIYSKYLADIVIPQEYGLTVQEKLTIGQGICTPLLKKIRADLQRNIEESGEETVNRLNPRYSHGVSSPGRHVRTRLYFTSESHVHSLLTVLRYGGLLDVVKDEQWRRAMEYVSMVSELNYMSQIVVMLYEDPTKDPSSEERFHVELHFSPGVNCCVQKNLPPGPGFRPHSRNESNQNLGDTNSGQDTVPQCSTRIDEEDTELGVLEDDTTTPPLKVITAPQLVEADLTDPMLDSPTTSRTIDMMDLDSNLMDEPFDSGFLQSSAPIPISARTVAGHEAARLGSQLAASQRQRREREAAGISEPRARSYDHQRQDKSDKTADKLQYQSLDAVNKEACAVLTEEQEPKAEVPVENPSLLSVPSCLGKPIILPHSISSPELPVPLTETSTPLVTLHSIPLASPGTLSPPVHEVMPIRSSYNPPVLLQAKKYSRSQSEMTLPNIEVTGELNDTCPRIKLPWAELSSTSSCSKVMRNKTYSDSTITDKRSRSLSPCLERCLCYNCTISELILQSRNLSPSERSNLRTYFVRSLSHKFSNCSCYSSFFYEVQKSLSDLWLDEVPPAACCCHYHEGSSYDCSDYPRGSQARRSTSSNPLFSTERMTNSFLESSLHLDRSYQGTLDDGSGSTGKVQLAVPVLLEGVTVDSQVSSTLQHCHRQDLDDTRCRVKNHELETALHGRSISREPSAPYAGHRLSRTMSCSDMGARSNRIGASDSSQTPHCLFDTYPVSPLHSSCSPSIDAIHVQRSTLGLDYEHKLVPSCPRSNICNHYCTQCKYNHSESSKRPRPRFQTQRSFSSPDTIIQPDPTCTARRHRHSISGQMSYFKLLGYNVSKKLTGSTNSLFSTAVISGSSSAPNLKDMVPSHASAIAAIEGFGGVPPIRPLETLHNALSLRQLDSFLEMMTSAPLFRTPASSPPKIPSPGGSVCGSVAPNLHIGAISREYHSSDLEAVRYINPVQINYKASQDGETCDIRNQLSPTSPNSTGWSSGPQSFLSSEPSSPAPTSTGECSMSISLVSNDRTEPFNVGPKSCTASCLDLDCNEICMSIDRESRGSVSYIDYYSNEDGEVGECCDESTCKHRQSDICSSDVPVDSVDDDDDEDHDHTLTLRQSEEQKKQDVKFIFEQKDSLSMVKPSSSYKKIGRFRVESMEISDDDVRIKDTCSLSLSLSKDKTKPSVVQKVDYGNQERSLVNSKDGIPSSAQPLKKFNSDSSSSNCGKRKNFLRSQSISTPKTIPSKFEVDPSCKCASSSKQSSFTRMSSENLDSLKLSVIDPAVFASSSMVSQQEPLLTVASSVKDKSNIKIGFNVESDKKDL